MLSFDIAKTPFVWYANFESHRVDVPVKCKDALNNILARVEGALSLSNQVYQMLNATA